MARNLQPRSALTPPRSPAPINATRPDFPVRAGQFLGYRMLCLVDHTQPNSLRALQKVMMFERFGLCAFDVSDSVSRQSLLMRALSQTIPHRNVRCDPASSCRYGYPPMRSTRSPKNGAPLPSVGLHILSSSVKAAAGGVITAKSNFSIACARPFG
jgi:hypothetical protein